MPRAKIEIQIWPHSTGNGAIIDQENAGPRDNVFSVIADDFSHAVIIAEYIAQGIMTNPRVWQAPIRSITVERG